MREILLAEKEMIFLVLLYFQVLNVFITLTLKHVFRNIF